MTSEQRKIVRKLEAQAKTITRSGEKLEEARILRDRMILLLLETGLGAQAVAEAAGVTRGWVYRIKDGLAPWQKAGK